jgi:hypothetical protein
MKHAVRSVTRRRLVRRALMLAVAGAHIVVLGAKPAHASI